MKTVTTVCGRCGAKPDPALGVHTGELCFWLGWTQELAGDHGAAQESWRQARRELEPFLKEQPDPSLSFNPTLLQLDPMFDPLHKDSRFRKLCEEKQP